MSRTSSSLVLQAIYVDADSSIYGTMPTVESPSDQAETVVTAFPETTRRSLAVSHALRIGYAMIGEQLRGASAASVSAAPPAVHFALSALWETPLELASPLDARMAGARVSTGLTVAQQHQQLLQQIPVPPCLTEPFEGAGGAFAARATHDVNIESGIDIGQCVDDAIAKKVALARALPDSAVSLRVTVLGSRPHKPKTDTVNEARGRAQVAGIVDCAVTYIDLSRMLPRVVPESLTGGSTVAVAETAADVGPLVLRSFGGGVRRPRATGTATSRWTPCLIRHVRTISVPVKPPTRAPPSTFSPTSPAATLRAAQSVSATTPVQPSDDGSKCASTPVRESPAQVRVDAATPRALRSSNSTSTFPSEAGEGSPSPQQPARSGDSERMRRDSVLQSIMDATRGISEVSEYSPQAGLPLQRDSAETGQANNRAHSDEREGDSDII